MSAMSDNARQAAETKMREAGQHEEAIRAFLSAFDRLESGESAMLPSAELTPAGDVPRLEDLPDGDGEALAPLVVIKLNGGLATTMGLRSPKSLVRHATATASSRSSSVRRSRCAAVTTCAAADPDEQRGHAGGDR